MTDRHDGCPWCGTDDLTKHSHDTALASSLLMRWLIWANNWRDEDMRQAMVADTERFLQRVIEERPTSVSFVTVCATCGHREEHLTYG